MEAVPCRSALDVSALLVRGVKAPIFPMVAVGKEGHEHPAALRMIQTVVQLREYWQNDDGLIHSDADPKTGLQPEAGSDGAVDDAAVDDAAVHDGAAVPDEAAVVAANS